MSLRNLHNTDFIFQPKRGIASNINKLANRNSAVAGEIAFTTDTGQLWAFNAITGYYEEVNKYTSYIFNSSTTPSGNRFADWSQLMTSVGGREVRIQFEQDETLPVGDWNVSYQTWVGDGQNPDGGAPVITLPTGFTFSSATNWSAENGLYIKSVSTSPIFVQSVATSHLLRRVALNSTTAPFFSIPSAGLHAFMVADGGGFINAGAPIIEYTGDPYSAYIVVTEQGISPVVEDDVISSTTPAVVLLLKQSSEVSSGFATNAGLDPASSVSTSLFSNAKVTGFPEGQPAGIPEDNVADALAGLASRIAVLEP